MPRPGPRPYECVRRAWHSDRHQPTRGSIIREIFRVANDIHRPATKKNKEWQEKLPIVVLKVEEIMYSKANSEAEYLDLQTLFDRANDAINTIIRRDESTETGDMLQPCIEAALHIGCSPRRSSRSQRHNIPKCYLAGAPKTSISQGSNTPFNVSHPLQPQLCSLSHISNPLLAPCYPNLVLPSRLSCTCLDPQSSSFVQGSVPSLSCHDIPSPSSLHSSDYSTGLPSARNHLLPAYDRAYPLYYGLNQTSQPWSEPQPRGNLFVNSPSHIADPISSKDAEQSQSPKDSGFDLSLRLGPFPAPKIVVDRRSVADSADAATETYGGPRAGDFSLYNVMSSKVQIGKGDDGHLCWSMKPASN